MVFRDWTLSLDCASGWTTLETNNLVQIMWVAGFHTVEALAASTWPVCKANILATNSMATTAHMNAARSLWLEATVPPICTPPVPLTDTLALARAIASLSKATAAKAQQKPRNKDLPEASDSEEHEGVFDLGTLLSTDVNSSLDPTWFSEVKRLQSLALASQKASARNSQVLAASNIELWPPSWIGEDLPHSVRQNLIKTHTAKVRQDFCRFLMNTIVFWLSHFSVGIVTLPAVFAHICTLLRLKTEHSDRIATSYAHYLQSYILSSIKAGRRLELNRLIAQVDSDLLGKVLQKHKSSDKPASDEDLNHHNKRERRPSRTRRSSKARRTSRDRRPAKEDNPHPKRTSQPPAKTADPHQKHICFLHDPSRGLNCSSTSCRATKSHLDTNKDDLKARYDKAKGLFDSRKAGR